MLRCADFKCNDCEHIEEQFYKQSSFEEKTLKCPKCESTNLDKLLGSPQIIGGATGSVRKSIPTGFKEVLGAVRKGLPAKERDTTKWSAL